LSLGHSRPIRARCIACTLGAARCRAVGEGVTGLEDESVANGAGIGKDRSHGVAGLGNEVSEVADVAEWVNASVGAAYPVSVTGGRGCHAYDVSDVEAEARKTSGERSISKVEYAAVFCAHTVSVSAGAARDAVDWFIECNAAHAPVECGVAVGEDSPVLGNQPVATAIGGGSSAYDRPGLLGDGA